jgi:cell fate regulator YaaT (PSP1 superfamily)
MPTVVGISFKPAAKAYFFDPNGLTLQPNDIVVAETMRGVEMGEVRTPLREVAEDQIVPPLRRVLRVATPEDFRRKEANRDREESALETCRRRIEARGLPMKLISAEYAFDGSQILFYFTAEGRVDFRELVKDLAAALRTRIQLHQIGARDAAKLLGGIGPCGRGLCCATWLTSFEPISMKMAKEQSLFLNPTKFSGVCGKLMCCLRYEYESYREMKSQLPPIGAEVLTPRGKGRVTGHNVLKEWLFVELPDVGEVEFRADEVRAPMVTGCRSSGGCSTCTFKKLPPPRRGAGH